MRYVKKKKIRRCFMYFRSKLNYNYRFVYTMLTKIPYFVKRRQSLNISENIAFKQNIILCVSYSTKKLLMVIFSY